LLPKSSEKIFSTVLMASLAPIDKLSVVLLALFGVAFLGERPSLNGWFGIALIAAGAVLIVKR
jgi:bacterial/archaeal transporter family protein